MPEPQGHLFLVWDLCLGPCRLMRAGPEPTAECEVFHAELSCAGLRVGVSTLPSACKCWAYLLKAQG